MRMILLISCLLLCFNAYSQDSIFSYEIRSIVQNGKKVRMQEGESYSLTIASGNKGTKVYLFDGQEIVSAGDALLVRSYRKEETASSYAGRVNEYSWQRNRNDGVKVPTKLTFRVAFTPTGTTFICDMEAENNIFQYEGLVYDISKPSGLK